MSEDRTSTKYIRPRHCPTPPDGMGALETLHEPRARRRGRGRRSSAYRAIKRDWNAAGRTGSLKSFARAHAQGDTWLANKKVSER